jgi:hypothetical protein
MIQLQHSLSIPQSDHEHEVKMNENSNLHVPASQQNMKKLPALKIFSLIAGVFDTGD